jgi:hypothetical protein
MEIPKNIPEERITRAENTQRVARRAWISFNNPNLTPEQIAELSRLTPIAQLAAYFDIEYWKDDVRQFVELTDPLMIPGETSAEQNK